MTNVAGPFADSLHGATDSPLDVAHLSHQTFGDADLQAELLGLFVKQAEAIVAAIGGLAGAGRSQAADHLHMLCGSARAIGFWQVGAAAEQLERSLRRPEDHDGDAGRAGLAALTCAVEAACRVAETRLRRSPV